MKHVKIIDTTLREGEQAAYVYFTLEQKLKIVELLTQLNIDEIELGVCVENPDIKDLINISRKIASAKLSLWSRLVRQDIETALSLSPDIVSISIPVSELHIYKKLHKTPRQLLELAEKEISWLRRNTDIYISVGLEDATRADKDFLLTISKLLEDCGINRIRIADTLGILDPITTYSLIKELRENVRVDLGIHTHNDFGMATANAISAFIAGVNYIDVTACGLGERAGNAALEEVVSFLSKKFNITKYNLKILKKLCHFVAEVACYPISPKKPIVGEEIFTCESGIHIDGLLKSTDTYEPFSPEELGLSRKFLIGKKAGKRAVEAKLKELGIHVDNYNLEFVFKKVKEISTNLNRCLTDEEIKNIATTAY